MTTPPQTGQAAPGRRGHRAIRLVALCLAVAALLFLAVIGWIPGR